MKTILAPTDFSAPSKNAALYALHLAKDLNAHKIILFNAYQPAPLVIAEPATTSIPAIDIQIIREISDAGMQKFKQEIQQHCPAEIQLEAINDFASIADGINDICAKSGADLVVMGITGTSKIEEVLIGSTSTSVMKNTKIPVIIVPEEARYSVIRNIMFACDYKKVAETTPVEAITNILNATNANLHIVNVSESEKTVPSDTVQQQSLLLSLFKGYEPHFHFEHNKDFMTGINHFVETHNIDLIITIPKKHTFFEGLFRASHSKKLAFHSQVPLMCIHDEDL
jgi:nucleotide-binding universal stress UspA family protein